MNTDPRPVPDLDAALRQALDAVPMPPTRLHVDDLQRRGRRRKLTRVHLPRALGAAAVLAAAVLVTFQGTGDTATLQPAHVPAPSSSTSPNPGPGADGYLVNAHGQTYGGVPVDDSGMEAWPDLVSTLADDGKTRGYVKKTDMVPDYASLPTTVEETRRWQAEHRNDPPRVVPVYAEDGTTVIGTSTSPALTYEDPDDYPG